MKNKKELLFWLMLLILIVLTIILPPSGKTALLEEFCSVLIIWFGVIYVVWKIVKAQKAEKTSVRLARMIVIAVCILVGSFFSKNLVTDIFHGPETILLYHPKVSKYQGYQGIISMHYYLSGVDAGGNLYRLKISSKEYETIQRQSLNKIEVEYYEQTDRLVQYR